MTGRVNHIIFDLSEVYIQGMMGIERFVAPQLGMDEAHVWRHMNRETMSMMFRGEATEDDYWADFMLYAKAPQQTGDTPTLDFLKSAMRKNFTEIEGTGNIIAALRDAGYEMTLLSDHAKEWVAYIEPKFPLSQFFPVGSHEETTRGFCLRY